MKLLMCPPLYYRSGAEERQRALSQWRGLYRLLQDQLAVDVDLLEPRPDVPSLVHVGTGGFLAGGTLVADCLADGSGTPESEPLENFFLVRGYHIEHLHMHAGFEGNRNFLAWGDTLFAGLHAGNLSGGQGEIEAIVDTEVVGLEIANGWPGPLATGLCLLGEGEALFCPTAFTDAARAKLEARIPRLVAVDEKKGSAAMGNALIVGRDVIVPQNHSVVVPTLESQGLTVHECPLEEFSEEGGPRTLVLQLE